MELHSKRTFTYYQGVGRPRTASDDDILRAAFRVVTRLGPGGLTLAEVAKEIGLSAAALVQRFGSKRGLLLALAGTGSEGVARRFHDARSARSSPLAALTEAMTDMTAFASTPEALANHLAFFQLDLRDPDFHRLALDHARALRHEVRSALTAAVDAGELNACDTDRLSRAVEVTYNGSLMTWAVHRHGQVSEWFRSDLELLLQPYLRRG